MKIMHFDVCDNDKPHIRSDREGCMCDSFSEETSIYDETVEIITGMYSSYFGENTLNCFPNIKKIVTRTTGYDNISLEYLSSKGVICLSVGSYSPQTIALHILSLLFYGLRDLSGANRNIQGHKIFTNENLSPLGIEGKTLGVIGVGNIGRSLIKMCRGFDLNILGYDICIDHKYSMEYDFTYVPFSNLLRQSDFIVLACNLTAESKNIINDSSLDLIKEGAILINCARGGLIDEEALLRSIKKFHFVGLDTLCQESENGIEKLAGYENIFISPHMAHLSELTIKQRWAMTYDLI